MKPILAWLLLIAAVNAVAAEPVPLPRPRPAVPPPPPWVVSSWAEPQSFREAAGDGFDGAAVSSAATPCNARLETIAVVTPVPRLVGPGACGGGDMVRLDAVLLAGDAKVDLKPAPYLRCAMAERLATWVAEDAVPRVAEAGARLARVETYDDFSCRGRNRAATGKVSEHGKGNAVDVRGFTLSDGRFIALTDVHADKPLRAAMRESACARFTTVLGPGSDGHHEAHIHLDAIERRNGYRICQWDVRDPPPPLPEGAIAGPVPLPKPRPVVADAPPRGRRL
ncbi:MAG: extensin family protein [Pseudolabrys sp.]